MFEGNVNKKSLLSNKVSEDSYILYKGKMVSSNLIDIEIIFAKHPDIRRKIMVDTHDEMRILASRVVENCDIFPKLGGLNSLVPKDFRKKTADGFTEIKKTGQIGEYILPKDIIYFDLNFYEIWLEVEMALECKSRSYVIKFDLKVVLNSIKSEFENTLIYLGIQSWAKIVTNDFYAFSDIIIDYPVHHSNPQSSSNIRSQQNSHIINNIISNSQLITFDFDDKLTCKLIFTNITDLIYEEITPKSERTISHSFSGSFGDIQRSTSIKTFFNDYFKMWLYGKTDFAAVYEHIIWRYQPQLNFACNELDDDNNSSFSDDSENLSFESNQETIIEHIRNSEGEQGIDFITTSCHKLILKTPTKHTDGIRGLSFQKLNLNKSPIVSGNKQKYKKEFTTIEKNIDYTELITKWSMMYIPLKEFDRKSPDTKNLIELCNGIREQFDIDYNDAMTNNHYEDNWKGKDRSRIKKWGWLIVIIILLAFLLYEFIL